MDHHRASRMRLADLERRAHDADRLRKTSLDLVPGGNLVWDASGRITHASDGVGALFGLPQDQLVGRDLLDLLQVGASDADRALVRDGLQSASRDGDRSLRLRVRRRDGSSFPLELRLRAVDLSGGPAVAGHVRDASDDECVAATKRWSKTVRQLIESLPEAVAVHSGGRLVYVNRRVVELLGYTSPEELIGRPPLALVDPDCEPVVRARMARIAATRQPEPIAEEWFVRRDGSVIAMDVLTVPISSDDDDATVILARESSERRRLEAPRALADRMTSVGRLAVGVAHGINNPLTYVIANTEFVIEKLGRFRMPDGKAPPAVEELMRLLSQAREGSLRIRDLVADLGIFSRTVERANVPMNVEKGLDAALSLAANEIRHRARVVKDYGPAPSVLADPSRLAHAFTNLLMNAAYAIPEGAAECNEIRIVTRSDDLGRALIEIRDTGAGMSPDVVARIFDPFFTTKAAGEGSGLGLAITYEIVATLGGVITAKSEVGRGSVFRILLPAADPPAEPAPQIARRPRVLVADDEPLILEMCERILVPNYEVHTAGSGRAALERIEAGETFDVIVCDLMMPDVTGMELHERLRRSAPHLADHMILMTGGAFTTRAQAFLDKVPNLKLEKPFDGERILRVIEECLSR